MRALPFSTPSRLTVLAVGGALCLVGCAGAAAAPQEASATGAVGGPVSATTTATATSAAATSATATSAPASSAPSTSSESTPAPSPEAGDPSGPVATDPPRPAATDVVLSYSYWDPSTASVLASGYVSPEVEDGGTCTLVLTRAGRSVTASAPAAADASTTSCPELAVPGAQLAAGEWSAVLRYSSATTEGESPAATVEVTT